MLRHAPRAVTLHFRGVRSIGVSPYWLGDPGGDLRDSNEPLAKPVFLPTNRPLRRDEAAPLLRLRPLQGSTQRGPPTSLILSLRKATETAQLATLMEFLPLRRLSPSESTSRRFATPTTFRPQGFSPSRRFAPRPDARPCFMPVTPMGFALQGFSPTVRSHQLSPVRLPSWCFSSAPQSKLRNAVAPASPQRAYVTRL
jgi:hypothetical protein